MSSQEIAYQPVNKIRVLQEEKLQQLLNYVSNNSPFYKNLFAKHGIRINTIKTLEDLTTIPTTSKEDLQQYNDDFLCVPRNKVIEYTSTSGTLGSPVTIALTEGDLSRLGYNEYNSFRTTGGSSEDIYQLMLTLDRQFMAGMAYYSGIRKMGAGIIRLGPGVPSLQWETILKLKPTNIVAVPSFILKLIQYVKSLNVDINSSTVKKAICIGETIRNMDCTFNILGKKIKESWDIELYSTYASTEMQTAFTECSEGKGGHNQPDLLILEVLDENDKQVPANVSGEITITTLGVEGMPLIRYKTGDIAMYFEAPCNCGRNSLRLSPILGRKKQMIKFKGTTLYPTALFDLLNDMPEVEDYVIEVNTNEIGLDEILLYIVPATRTEENDHKIRAYLQAKLRVTPSVKYLKPEELQQLLASATSRKISKLLDKRK